MSDIGDGLGAAVEGALVGRTLEPRHGEMGSDAPEPTACLNCGSSLSSQHCPRCGQKRDVHRSLAAIGHDIMHGVLHLDGKLWRTLPLLALKPGELTRRYIAGERAKFVSPMAMFLFSVFLMFAVFQLAGISTPTDVRGDARSEVERLVEAERERVTDQLAGLERQLDNTTLSEAERTELEVQQQRFTDDLALLQAGGGGISQWIAGKGSEPFAAARTEAAAQVEDAKERLHTLPENSPARSDLAAEIAIAEQGIENLERVETISLGEDGKPAMDIETSGVPFVDEMVEKWRENPSLMLYKMQNNAYKFSWLLIPLSIPFVWSLFFWRRRFKAYDHAIFVTYSLGFMSLLFITLSLLGVLGVSAGWLIPAAVLIPPVHIFRQLRGAYELGVVSAFGRTIALLAMIVFGISFMFLWILLLLGAL